MGETAIVTLKRCGDYSRKKVYQIIAEHFELLGGIDSFLSRGDRVLLKPNFIAPRSPRRATQTHPAILIETARLLKDFGAKPFIGDSPAWSNVKACVRVLNMEQQLKKLGVDAVQLKKSQKCRISAEACGVKISRIALEADAIINIPKFKSHQQLVCTFVVKNMFGCVSGKQKAIWHFIKGRSSDDFCKFLIDIYRYMKPVVNIIDAVKIMEGPGPIRGRPRDLGWIVGGTDAIACEIVCGRLINMQPENIPIVRAATQIGFGCTDEARIKILGDEFAQEVCKDFEMPKLIPIRFSLAHVMRSMLKQIWLLVKPLLSNQGKINSD